MSLLDLIFPKRCVNCARIGSYVCESCFTYISFAVAPICLVCNRQTYTSLTHERCQGRFVIDGAFSSVVFGKVVKKLIYQFKYKPHLYDLRSFIGELFYEGIIQNEAFFRAMTGDALLVPIPLHSSKFRQRGYNQAAMLGEELSKRLKIPIADLLERIRVTGSQFVLDRAKRRENIRGAFAVKKGESMGHTVFLIDDVLTSGATLLEAAKVLKHHGVKRVYGLTLAHGN